MEQGWIYVLVNSSTPGLAKVGRTCRPPAERAAELSAATGVATPFVVAFDQAFADCCEAERLVHAVLDKRGLRVAPNREFFRGAVSEIIRVIMEIAGTSPPGDAAGADASAERLRVAGDCALFGRGDTLQDTGEALRCYKLAAARGSLVAYQRVGEIYVQLYLGARNRVGRRRAMNVLKEGVRRGNYYCYAEMATIFTAERHFANFAKCWDLFFARRADSFLDEVEEDGSRFAIACSRHITQALALEQAPSHIAELTANADAILAVLLAELDRVRDEPLARRRVTTVMRWAFQSLLPGLPPAKPLRRRQAWWFGERDSAVA